jgi:diguanylate cyclase (GGDEF)-like protein
VTDLTYQQALALFRHFPGFLSIRNAQHQYVYLNDQFTAWLRQYSDADPIGLNASQLAKLVPSNVGDMLNECHDASLEYLEAGQCAPKILTFQGLDSVSYFNVLKFKVYIDGEPYIYTTSFDVSDLHHEVKFFEKKAYTDPLTKLHNLAYLSSVNWHSGFCVVIDLDNFKHVNDSSGHSEGDIVLMRFSRCLRQAFSGQDILVRYGGDEFVVLTHDKDEARLNQALDKLSVLFQDNFVQYPMLCHSIGYAPYQTSLRITLKKADLAMYQSKHTKRSVNSKNPS